MSPHVIKLLCLVYLVDSAQAYLCGPIRALGITDKASTIALGSMYIVGLPLACLLAFKADWGVMGLQLGIGGAVLMQAALYT